MELVLIRRMSRGNVILQVALLLGLVSTVWTVELWFLATLEAKVACQVVLVLVRAAASITLVDRRTADYGDTCN